MGLYILLLLISIAISILDFSNLNKKYKYLALLLFGGMCAILSGVRWQTGTDWDLYYDFYHDNNTLSDFLGDANNPGRIESGYGLINYLHAQLFDDYNLFMLFIAAVIISIKMRWIIKYTKYPLIASMVYFTTYAGDIFFIRQYLAVAIVLLSFDFIIKKKPLHFFLMVAIASSIHISAIMFSLAYFLYHKCRWLTVNKMACLLGFCVILDVSQLNMSTLEVILDMFPSDIGSIAQKLHVYYMLQQEGENFGANIDNATRMASAYGRRLLFIPIYVYAYRYLKQSSVIYEGTLKLVLFGYALFFLCAAISYDFAGRLSLYYTFFEILLIASMFEIRMDKITKGIAYIFLVMYCIAKYVFLIYNFSPYYVPFTTVF
jgi:hypothetical protein